MKRTLWNALLLAFALFGMGSQAQVGIAWYGTWEQGYQAARASGKPILLLAAAPQCHGVSGIW